jgi:hypothetical protein
LCNKQKYFVDLYNYITNMVPELSFYLGSPLFFQLYFLHFN